LPFGYLAAAIVLAALLFPTALRPPPDLQSTSQAFSPDAPPEDTPPEALLQSLRQARSSTAGSKEVEAAELVDEQEEAAPPPPPPPKKRAAQGKCYGDPPRQTESLYSALCVPAFTGDNGGATAKGVTADTINVIIVIALGDESPEGPLGREFSEADTPIMHDLKVWQHYFNDRYVLYGRYLQFVLVRQSSTNTTQQKASVETQMQYQPFAAIGNASAAVDELVKRGVIEFGAQNNPVPYYNEHWPYVYSFALDSWQTRYMGTELACKHFAGKPPGELNEKQDPTFDYNAPRKWGLLSYQDTTRTGASAMISELAARCGIKFELTQEYNITDNQQSIGGSMAKFKAAGVTTVMLNVDGLTPALLSTEAQNIRYFPEYIHTGTGEMDSGGTGRLMDDNQARHIVGLSPNEIPRPDEDKDWYRAYKEIDPEGEPEAAYFRSLQQLAGGIQMAGPKLTPQTFYQGLIKQPYRVPNPVWASGGGYRDSFGWIAYKDLTYEDYLSIIWFDQTQHAEGEDFTGAWCHVFMGKRFRVTEIPTEPIPWFDRSQCIVDAPRGVFEETPQEE
jgi:hypothetical protein